MDYIKYLQIKNQQVNDSVRNLTIGHVWIFLPDNNTNWAQNQASAMAIPVLWPEPCSEEMKHQHGAGNLKDLERFWMKEWSLMSCQVSSSGIIGENVELC